MLVSDFTKKEIDVIVNGLVRTAKDCGYYGDFVRKAKSKEYLINNTKVLDTVVVEFCWSILTKTIKDNSQSNVQIIASIEVIKMAFSFWEKCKSLELFSKYIIKREFNYLYGLKDLVQISLTKKDWHELLSLFDKYSNGKYDNDCINPRNSLIKCVHFVEE